MTPKVFIASSSEGRDVARAVRGLLLQELGDDAEVTPWTRAFELGETYIENLDRAAREADFAVLVLTPDDVTTSREIETLAPRDNVIFELGLFTGSLGRMRCFLVHEQRPDLKLPTDLLGVKAATFKRSGGRDLNAALDAVCIAISERITALGSRQKPSLDALAAQAAMRRFYDRIVGSWWERLVAGDRHRLGFFQIELEEPYNSVQLQGRVYDPDGALNSHWKSAVARVLKEDKKIVYLRQCWHPGNANASWFHGFGETDFEGPADANAIITRGQGKFWDVDQADPKQTMVKPIEIRRVSDQSAAATMTGGKESEVRSLIATTLREW